MNNAKTVHELIKAREVATSELIKDCGVFFAFSKSQYDEGAKELVDDFYTATGFGGYLPSKNVSKYMDGMIDIFNAFEKFVNDKGLREEYINYELGNHEAWYTGDIDSTKSALIGTYTDKELWDVYNKYREVNSNY